MIIYEGKEPYKVDLFDYPITQNETTGKARLFWAMVIILVFMVGCKNTGKVPNDNASGIV